ncbi:MAG: CHAT domain-containing protein [Leptolyngbya sp. BL-A-14]
MQLLNRLKFYFNVSRFPYWLAFLTCSLVIISHPAIAVDRTQAPPSILQTVVSGAQLLEQGKQQYESGQLKNAAELWQQATQAYQAQNDRLNQALSLSYLSLVDQALGDWREAQRAINSSLDLLESLPDSNETKMVLAQALNTQGKLKLAQGQAEVALTIWQKAEKTYLQTNDGFGVMGSQINQAQALQTLGLYRRAKDLLEQIGKQLQVQPSSSLKTAGLRNLGVVQQVIGNLSSAQTNLQKSLTIAQELNLPDEVSATLFSLGNTARALQDSQTALQFYQRAAAIAPTATARLEAQVNQLSLLLEVQHLPEARTLVQQIEPQLDKLAPGRTSIYIRVNWAANAIKTCKQPSNDEPLLSTIAAQLATAINQARQLQDARAESFALGQLGTLYEQNHQLSEAKTLTKQALLIAQEISAPDIAYRWQWQLGRLFNQSGNRNAAIVAYTDAVKSLKILRRDLIAMSPDVQFSFREKVEPVYRELVTLLVQPETPSQSDLQQARQTIEALQLAEIENYLRSACLDSHLSSIDTADTSAAVFYPIILADRLTTILSVPGQPLKTYSTLLPSEKIEEILEQTLESFNPLFSDPLRLQLSEKLYNWLIRPAEASLATNHIKTLVFVLDGSLRNIPMAALYSGQHYLVEDYSVAITPGLQLLGPQVALTKGHLDVLIGALTEARQGFPALPGVAIESNAIASNMSSRVLLNQNFTQNALENRLKGETTPLIHLATHGQFSSQLDKTFILTWDNQISIEGVRSLLRSRSETGQQPIELLVLSACETAEGDKRAALGLAGLAVRSGARSTVASLWSVNDASTAELMAIFYQSLAHKGLSKAESLRESQLSLLHNAQYQHPYYWAPFILVGNWL